MQPPNIPSDAWPAIFSVFTNEVGSTWGNYVSMLDKNASYLGQLGINVPDASKLMAFQMMQADGLCPLQTLASSVDASVPAPGLPLVFSRSFGERISQRYALGPLGRGWSHNWQYSLQTNGGAITIVGPGGSQRVFQPNKQGGYFNQAGDYGTIAPAGGGAYTLTEKTGLFYYYQANGALGYIQDLNNNRITLGYTGGMVTSLTHSSGQSLTLAYSGGLIQSVTDSAGRGTTFTYDGSQCMQTASYFNGTQVNYTYSGTASGMPQAYALTQIAYPDGTHLFMSYDSNGRLSSMDRDGGAEAITFSYGGAGSVGLADAIGNTSSYYFDNRGLQAQIQNPINNSLYSTYDKNFNLSTFTDQTGNASVYAYDGSGNLTQSVDALGNEAAFAYQTPFNRLALLSDPKGNSTKYTNDTKGNLRSIAYANNTSEGWNYDTAGDPVTWTNRRGQIISYLFNANGQPARKTYPDGHTINYYYNSHYLPTNITDSLQGSTVMDFDPRDFLTNITYPNGKGFSFLYDNAGRRITRTSNDGYTLNYSYDTVGRLAALSNNLNGLLVQYSYDAAGRLALETKGNGAVTTYAYDNAGRIQAMTNFAPNVTVQSFFNYNYDSKGNRIAMATISGTTTYGYDALNQLISANYPNGRQVTYSYDSLGNRTVMNDTGTNTAYTANAVNEYTQVGAATFFYDADGNLTNCTGSSGTTNYQYDFENRLVSVITPTNGTWQYVYDSLGNRAATVNNGTTNQLLIDPFGLADEAAEYTAQGLLLARYDNGLGLVSLIDGAGNIAFYGFDALGNTRQLTGNGGAILNNYDYDAFGGATSVSESVPNAFRFVGRFGVSDESNGLQFMRARFYIPPYGRFVSPDPLNLGGQDLNLYRYAQNASTCLTDPSGEDVGINLRLSAFIINYVVRNQLLSFGVRNQTAINELGALVKATFSLSTGVPLIPSANVAGTIAGRFSLYRQAALLGWTVGSAMAPSVNQTIFNSWYDFFSSRNQWPVLPLRSSINQTNESATPGDPNELTGPAGFGMQAYVTESNLFGYGIYFENETNATAAAQDVQITDPLPATLDWQTFQLGEIAFGNVFVPIPPHVQYFQTNI
ncbi:MAG TPA: RHS repeat-associated core domain-containing protein, partial [Verrucomicrobiae bacterium]|nr:RHS repeat-associated core domain-containing protein [Verrucomicrobiae bacterium]